MDARTRYRLLKRALDVTGATVGLFAAAPLIGTAALAVAVESGGPVLFRQQRIGRGGVPFTVYKLRSMRPDGAGTPDPRGGGEPSGGDESHRVTRVGRVLRRWAIDELPQLVNVLRGEMSLVGPRPLIPEHAALLNGHEDERHSVKPGLTGWAAVTRATTRTWDERIDKDVYYVRHASLWMDLAILLLSVPAIASYGEPHGANARRPTPAPSDPEEAR